MAGLFTISSLAFYLERTRWGAQISGAVIAILGAILASNLGLLPHSAPAYDFVFNYFVPVLIPLFLFQADLRRMVREAARLTVAFFVASVATVAGVTLAALSLDLSPLAANVGLAPELREPAIAGLFASTYIGGSVNYAALGEITGLNQDASFFSAVTAADNLFSALYLAFLALLPGARWIVARFAAHREQAVVDPAERRAVATGAGATAEYSRAGDCVKRRGARRNHGTGPGRGEGLAGPGHAGSVGGGARLRPGHLHRHPDLQNLGSHPVSVGCSALIARRTAVVGPGQGWRAASARRKLGFVHHNASFREPVMTKNEGAIDRGLRIVAGLVLLSLVAIGPQTLWGLVGIVPLATGLMGYCPAYSLLGMNTCPASPSQDEA